MELLLIGALIVLLEPTATALWLHIKFGSRAEPILRALFLIGLFFGSSCIVAIALNALWHPITNPHFSLCIVVGGATLATLTCLAVSSKRLKRE